MPIVLLMYAEALNEVSYNGDPNGDAFKYLNMVRTRSGATLSPRLNWPARQASGRQYCRSGGWSFRWSFTAGSTW